MAAAEGGEGLPVACVGKLVVRSPGQERRITEGQATYDPFRQKPVPIGQHPNVWPHPQVVPLPYTPMIPGKYEPFVPNNKNVGWECPKCGSCYAPHVSKCTSCKR